jgi:hypothetical protein
MVCIVCEVLIRRVSTILCLLMICIQNPGRIGWKTVGWLVGGEVGGGGGGGVGGSKYTLHWKLYCTPSSPSKILLKLNSLRLQSIQNTFAIETSDRASIRNKKIVDIAVGCFFKFPFK